MAYGESPQQGGEKPVTVRTLKRMKKNGEKIASLTAYDYPTARLAEEAGIHVVLVGDSLGMVLLGYDSTIPVTMEDMIHHARAAARGTSRAMLVVDMPFMSYQISIEEAKRNAARLIQETGAQAVKLEGGRSVAGTVAAIVEAGIPVMGHIGLTPQSVHQLGGYRVVGRGRKMAARLLDDADAIEQAGAFALVLEKIPAQLAGLISCRYCIPTIGIGSGPECDGQVQVFHDILGLAGDFVPSHAKVFLPAGDMMRSAIESYRIGVEKGDFPTEAECTRMDDEVFAEISKAEGSR